MFQLSYDLLKNLHTARKKFEKSEKYSLGDRLEETFLDLLTSIMAAGQAKREWKIPALDRALHLLEKGKILVRLAADIHQLDDRRHHSMQEAMQKIGRMLGGWRKSI